MSKLSERDVLSKQSNAKGKGNLLPSLIPYNEKTLKISKILKRNWKLIDQDEKLKKILARKPFLAPQRHRNLADLLVYTKTVTNSRRQRAQGMSTNLTNYKPNVMQRKLESNVGNEVTGCSAG